MSFSVSFDVPVLPMGKPRHRTMVRGGRVFTHPSTKGQRWEQQFAIYAEQHAPPAPLEGAVQIDITAVFPRPKRLLRKKDPDGWLWHISRPDLDNVWKAVLDALKTWWRDDAQVSRGRTAKVYGGKEERAHLIVQVMQIVLPPDPVNCTCACCQEAAGGLAAGRRAAQTVKDLTSELLRVERALRNLCEEGRSPGEAAEHIAWQHAESCESERMLLEQVQGAGRHMGDLREVVREALPWLLSLEPQTRLRAGELRALIERAGDAEEVEVWMLRG